MRKYVLLDDMTGAEFQADSDEGREGVVLEFMGKRVTLDLATSSIVELWDMLRPYYNKGAEVVPEPVKVKPPRATSMGSNTHIDRKQAQAVREWALSQGMTVAPRGRIAGDVLAAYNEAHAGRPARPRNTPPQPSLPTATDLAKIHVEAQTQQAAPVPVPNPFATVIEQLTMDPEPESDTGGDDTPDTVEIDSAGLHAWLLANGHDPSKLKHLARLSVYRKANPGVKVVFVKGKMTA